MIFQEVKNCLITSGSVFGSDFIQPLSKSHTLCRVLDTDESWTAEFISVSKVPPGSRTLYWPDGPEAVLPCSRMHVHVADWWQHRRYKLTSSVELQSYWMYVMYRLSMLHSGHTIHGPLQAIHAYVCEGGCHSGEGIHPQELWTAGHVLITIGKRTCLVPTNPIFEQVHELSNILISIISSIIRRCLHPFDCNIGALVVNVPQTADTLLARLLQCFGATCGQCQS